MRSLLLLPLVTLAACATPPAAVPQAPAPVAAPAPEPAAELATLRKQAGAAMDGEDYARALELYRQVQERAPDDAVAVGNAGLALVRLGRVEEGVKELERSLQLKELGSTHFYLAGALGQLGRKDAQRVHLERAAELDPAVPEVWLALVNHRLEAQDFEGAVRAADRLRAIAPASQRTYEASMLAALSHSAQGRKAEALQQVSRAMASEEAGRAEEAIAAYRAALALEPAYAHARLGLAGLLRARGDRMDAERALRMVIRDARPNEEVLRAEAQHRLADLLLERRGMGQEAAELARQSLSHCGRLRCVETLARACDASGDTACALESYRKLLADADALPAEVRARAEARLKALEAAPR